MAYDAVFDAAPFLHISAIGFSRSSSSRISGNPLRVPIRRSLRQRRHPRWRLRASGLRQDGKIPRVGRVLLADSVGTIFGSLSGTSTVTSYIESAAGVAAGARTGLSNIAVAALFLLAMFCSPLATAIPAYATAPALILVGVLMSQSLSQLKWNDFTEALPAFITMLATPLTFSIATGLSLGLISYTVVKVAAGKFADINALIWILTVLFLLRYVYLAAA